ncbi:hypothetical protein [Streptomyces sp. NPDC057257]|uniref:hypothetical protein n=1 Tax=Streptomyces sp. NPDC057257 TaxID=3346071 RepID=UPI003645D044
MKDIERSSGTHGETGGGRKSTESTDRVGGNEYISIFEPTESDQPFTTKHSQEATEDPAAVIHLTEIVKKQTDFWKKPINAESPLETRRRRKWDRDKRAREAEEDLRRNQQGVGKERDIAAVHRLSQEHRIEAEIPQFVRAYQELTELYTERYWLQADAETLSDLSELLASDLSTLGRLANDEAIWSRLRSAARQGVRASVEEVERLISITWLALPALLEVFGYSDPPPPSADELVYQTQIALSATLEASIDGEAAIEAVDQAKERLDNFLDLVRDRASIDFSSQKQRQDLLGRLTTDVGPLILATVHVGASDAAAQAASSISDSIPVAEAVRTFVGPVAERIAAIILAFFNRDRRSKNPEESAPEDLHGDWGEVCMAAHIAALSQGVRASQNLALAAYTSTSAEGEDKRQEAWSTYRQSIELAGQHLTRLQKHLQSHRRFSGSIKKCTLEIRSSLDRVSRIVEQPTLPIQLWTGSGEESSLFQSINLLPLVASAALLRKKLSRS